MPFQFRLAPLGSRGSSQRIRESPSACPITVCLCEGLKSHCASVCCHGFCSQTPITIPWGLAHREALFSEGMHTQMAPCLKTEQIADQR